MYSDVARIAGACVVIAIDKLDQTNLERLARIETLDRIHRAWVHDLNGRANALVLQLELARATGGADASRLEKIERLSVRHRAAVAAYCALARPPVDPVGDADLRSLVGEIVEACAPVAETRRIAVEVDELPAGVVQAQPQHLRLAVTRVLLDAIERSRAPVRIGASLHPDRLELILDFSPDPDAAVAGETGLTAASLDRVGATYDEQVAGEQVRGRLSLPTSVGRR